MAIHIHVHKKARDGRTVENREKAELLNAVRKARDLAAALANSTGDREVLAVYKALDALPNLIATIKAPLGSRDAGTTAKIVERDRKYWYTIGGVGFEYGPFSTPEAAGEKARSHGHTVNQSDISTLANRRKDHEQAAKIYVEAKKLDGKIQKQEDQGVTVAPVDRQKYQSLASEYRKFDAEIRRRIGDL